MLLGADLHGLNNVVVVNGDPFKDSELYNINSVNDFKPTELISSIKAMNTCLDFRGKNLLSPTKFCVGATIDLARDIEGEMFLTRKKVQQGADFFILQSLFEPEHLTDFLEHYHCKFGEPLNALVFCGVQVMVKDSISFGNVPDWVKDDLYKGRGLELRKIGNKFMFKTSSDLTFIMQREAKSQRKLSKAAIETLAIIAYHQPVTRAEIEEIRGVSVSSGTIDTLLQMNWVKINGRRRVPGNPLAYGTTEEFLVHFDLESIKDLPEMQELKSMGLLDSNLPPDLYPENTINNNSIDEINDINTIEDSGEK